MISVVVPALNEAEALPALLAALAAQYEAHEIIVADGGSTDATVAIAESAGARVVTGAQGRGAQLRAGAAAARGDMLWFLHADSRVAKGALYAVQQALADPRTVGGNFKLLFAGERRFNRFMEWFYPQLRRLGMYYGDSGIFVRRTVYDALGGIKPLPLMEDYEFARRLNRAGHTVCLHEPPLVTSSRRFDGRGGVRILGFLLWIHILYWLGVSPAALARRYRSGEHSPGRRR